MAKTSSLMQGRPKRRAGWRDPPNSSRRASRRGRGNTDVHATKREIFAKPEPTSIQLKEASKNGTNNMGKKQITRNC